MPSLLGKKFPAPVGTSIEIVELAGMNGMLMKISTARPMTPFYVAGMFKHPQSDWDDPSMQLGD